MTAQKLSCYDEFDVGFFTHRKSKTSHWVVRPPPWAKSGTLAFVGRSGDVCLIINVIREVSDERLTIENDDTPILAICKARFIATILWNGKITEHFLHGLRLVK